MHTPVLLQEVMQSLNVKSGGKYIDATAGEGGHTRALLEAGAQVLAIDRDRDQINKLKKAISNSKLNFAVGNFADLESIAKASDFYPADGVLLDLGLSMVQLAQSGRGFSYKYGEEPLDMRVDVRQEITAADVLNTSSEDELYDCLARFGEDVHSQLIAQAAVKRRIRHKFAVVEDFVQLVHEVLSKCTLHHYHNTNDTLSRVFQALRMQVNQEVENLKSGLAGAVNVIDNDGKIAVITFHSVEDRIVKQFIRANNLVYVKELKRNTSSKKFEKSAKLRVFKRPK